MPRVHLGTILLVGVLALRGAEEGDRGLRPVPPPPRSATPAAASPVLYRESHALLVGCSTYRLLTPLPGVVGDIQAVAAGLRRHGFTITTLLDPDTDAFESGLRRFLSEHGQEVDARIVVYFAGHGVTRDRLGYILPVDGVGADHPEFLRRAILIDDFSNRARQLRTRHALFAFDSCFSGSLFATRSAPSAHVLEMARNPVRIFITSGSANQEVPDRSVFRDAFLDGIDGRADRNQDGFVLGEELFAYIQERVVNAGAANGHPQTPQRRSLPGPAGDDPGDLVFSRPGPEGPVAASSLQAPTSAPAWAVRFGHDACGTWADLDCAGVSQRLRFIPAGSFTMGSAASERGHNRDEVLRQVTLTRPFWLADSECTHGLYRAVTGGPPPATSLAASLPVTGVSWHEARTFCERLATLLPEIAPGQVGLPTEAQWEYSCRAGGAPYRLAGQAWFGGAVERPQAVRTRNPNAWGLHDMLGNVSEWCRDSFRIPPAQPATDPVFEAGVERVHRGGSWRSLETGCRPAFRSSLPPDKRNEALGFRFAITPP